MSRARYYLQVRRAQMRGSQRGSCLDKICPDGTCVFFCMYTRSRVFFSTYAATRALVPYVYVP